MGNSATGVGYGCELPKMVELWRSVWSNGNGVDTVAGAEAGAGDRPPLFGVATLAAGGSEGNGHHMAGMRWSQTANFGVLPNPTMPHSFLAQVYDLGDPWAVLGDGTNPGMDPHH